MQADSLPAEPQGKLILYSAPSFCCQHPKSPPFCTITLHSLKTKFPLPSCLAPPPSHSPHIKQSVVFKVFYCSHLFLLRSSFRSISSVSQLCPTLCDPIDCSTPGFPVYHQLPELAQSHVHRVGDAIQRSLLILCLPLLLLLSVFPSIRVFSNESVLHHQVAKVLEFQLQHQSFQ